MKNKPEFKPVITRVELNPEQAVLSCNCYSTGKRWAAGEGVAYDYVCRWLAEKTLTNYEWVNFGSSAASS